MRIDMLLDSGKREEPLMALDSGVPRSTKMLPWIQGDKYPLYIEVGSVVDGEWVARTIQEGETLSLVGKRTNYRGEILYSIPSFVPESESVDPSVWEATLDLHTADLSDAMGSFPKLTTRTELVLERADDVIYSWHFLVDINREVWHGTAPLVPGGPSYLTEAETNAQFARRDGPDGYGTRLVELDGELHWAQLVGTNWVVQRIVEIGGQYYTTYHEVTP